VAESEYLAGVAETDVNGDSTIVTKCVCIVAFCLAAAAGCAGPGQSSSTADPGSTRRSAFEAATAAFHQALRSNDAEALFAFVADDVLMMPPGEAAVRGKGAMREWYARFLSQYRTSSLTLSDREVFVSDGWAVELGAYEWGLVPAAGGAAGLDRGSYMQVWKSQPDGRWHFEREIWNSSTPPSPPAVR
jgi:ketosteroid isomerase-like protein